MCAMLREESRKSWDALSKGGVRLLANIVISQKVILIESSALFICDQEHQTDLLYGPQRLSCHSFSHHLLLQHQDTLMEYWSHPNSRRFTRTYTQKGLGRVSAMCVRTTH
jgi:hypothetical protein